MTYGPFTGSAHSPIRIMAYPPFPTNYIMDDTCPCKLDEWQPALRLTGMPVIAVALLWQSIWFVPAFREACLQPTQEKQEGFSEFIYGVSLEL